MYLTLCGGLFRFHVLKIVSMSCVSSFSRDKLVFLNSLDLSEVEVYQWKDEENEKDCHNPATSTFDSSSPEVRSHDSHVIPVDHI